MAQWLRLGGDTWRHLAEQRVPSIYVHLEKKRAVQWQLKPTFSRRKTQPKTSCLRESPIA